MAKNSAERAGFADTIYGVDKAVNYGTIAAGVGGAALNLITVGSGAVIALGGVVGLKVSEKIKGAYDRVTGKKTLGSEATKRIVKRA